MSSTSFLLFQGDHGDVMMVVMAIMVMMVMITMVIVVADGDGDDKKIGGDYEEPYCTDVFHNIDI